MRRLPMNRILSGCVAMFTLVTPLTASQLSEEAPNVVILFTDDQGWADVGCFGAQGFETPHLDRLAAEGARFTDFYVAAAGCSPSRAALLTGCYPQRVGGGGGSPNSRRGLHPSEITIADLLGRQGYATACIGKWHLGWDKSLLPTAQGFDSYFGLPYSIDMWPFHPQQPHAYPDLPLMRDEQVVQLNADPRLLTSRYTEEAVTFIEEHREKPFFLYLAYSLPHVPLFASRDFQDQTSRGLYGDVISEIDWSVGRIADTLRSSGIAERTLVIFSSDNGPWLSYGTHGGSAGPLREGKGTTFEGGMREPCIMWWPDHIPAGTVCREVAATIDLLPTIAKLAGVQPPQDRVIDGRDIWPLMSGEKGAQSPHEAYFFYGGGELQAVRSGRWKLHFPHRYRSYDRSRTPSDGRPVAYVFPEIGLSLFDLHSDIGETTNVADQHPQVVSRLKELADQMRVELGDSRTGQTGTRVRPPGIF